MRCRKVLLAAVLLFHASIAFCEGQSKQVIVGAVASMTGPASEQGKNWVEGAQLAEDELKAQGLHVRFLVEDDASNPAKAASAFTKLATIDKADAVIGGTWDFLAEAIYPLALQYKVPFIVPTNPAETLSDSAKLNPYVLSSSFSMEAAEDGIRLLFEKHPARTAYLIYWGGPYGQHYAKIFKKLSQETGFKILGKTELSAGGSQELQDALKLGALKAAQSRAEMVFLLADYAGIDLFLRETNRLKVNPLLLCTHHLDAALRMTKNKELYRNAYGVYPAYRHEPFNTNYQNKFAHRPNVYAEAGYDTMKFITLAVVSGVDLSSTSATFSYDGISGLHHLPADNNRGVVTTHPVIMTTKNGVFEEEQ